MAYDARVYRVLIASPGDVEEERDVVSSVIQSWNDLYSYTRKVVLLPLRWETHTAPEYGTRPQEVINRAIVDGCDLLVGIFWTRIGSPTGVAESGTLEEIERVGKAGKPVMLYFSRVAIDPDRIEIDQIEPLKAFRKKTYPRGLVETYQKLSEFRDKFSRQLEMKVRDIQAADLRVPVPLSLTFLSALNGKSIGSDIEYTYRRPVVSDFGFVQADISDEVKTLFLEKVRQSSFHPIIIGVQNGGLTGVRNPYLEIEFSTDDPDLVLSDRPPKRRRPANGLSQMVYFQSFQHFFDGGEEDEDAFSKMDETFKEFTPGSLQKIENGWKLTLEWDAIQPQRLRLVKPFLFVSSQRKSKLCIRGRAFSDSFALPLQLQATISLDVIDVPTELASVLPNWEENARAIVSARQR